MTEPCSPRVSVLTMTHNHAPWIRSCIESVLGQTFQDWQQIILDDGSTDETPAMIAAYLDDPRIIYIRQENRGIWRLAENYNRALAASAGELIAILEGDDLWPPDKLEIQIPVFRDETVGLCYGRMLIVDDKGEIRKADMERAGAWQPPFASFEAASPLPFLRDLLLLRGNVGAGSLMFRHAVLEEAGGFFQPAYFPAVDFTTALRVATRCRAAFVDQPVGVWRCHAGQTTEVHGLAYALGHTRAAVEHFRALPVSVKRELGIAERDIWQARRGYLADAYWLATRIAMRAGRWSRARRYALGMLRWGNAFRAAEGVASFIAAAAHVDLNGLVARLAATSAGRPLVRR